MKGKPKREGGDGTCLVLEEGRPSFVRVSVCVFSSAVLVYHHHHRPFFLLWFAFWAGEPFSPGGIHHQSRHQKIHRRPLEGGENHAEGGDAAAVRPLEE
jgi:hypothetical protein